MGGADTDDGREVEGLSTLVQRRGAGRVIATLWRVEDASTAQLMRRLYAEFSAAHGDAALGLQEAQYALRSLTSADGTSYANPYYWAGFTVAGSNSVGENHACRSDVRRFARGYASRGPAISAAKVSATARTAACTGPEVIAGITEASTT